MSNRCITAIFQHSVSKGAARLVLLAMGDEANDQGLLTAYRRSHSHLAAKANVDDGTVPRAIDTLEAIGELLVLDVGNGRKSSDYRIVLPGLAEIEGVHPAPPDLSQGVQAAPPDPAPGAPRGREMHPQGKQPAPPIIPVYPDASRSTPVADAPPKRRTQIPVPFSVNDELLSWVSQRYPSLDWQEESEKFCSYHGARGTVMKDWNLAWQNWMHNAVKFNRQRHSQRESRAEQYAREEGLHG